MDDNFRNFRFKLIFLAVCILILLAIKGHIKLGYVPVSEGKSITVAFDYYGAFENEVEILVSRLEEAYMDLRGIKDIHSVSEPGKGYIICLFSEKTSLDEAYVQLSDITAHVYSDFPERVNRPVITRSSSDTYPVYISFFPLGRAADADRIKEAYESVPGTGEVQMGGTQKKELMLELHNGRFAGMALSTGPVDSRLRSSNLAREVAMPGGQTLILDSRLSFPAEYGQVYVASDLRLSDVANLEYSEVTAQSLGHIDGKSALLFFIMKSGEGDTVRLCRQLDFVTSHFGGSQFFSLGNNIKKSFIFSSSMLLLLFIFLLFDLWFKARSYHLAAQVTCRCIGSLLAAIAAVTTAGYQLDITVMAALFLVVCFSFGQSIPKKQNYILKKYNEPINMQDIAVLRSIGRKSINDFTSEDISKSGKWAYKFWQQIGTKSPFFRRWFGDWREADTSKVEALHNITVLNIKTQKEVAPYIKKKVKDGTFYRGDEKTNKDTGFKIIIGMKVYDDTVTYANRDYSRSKDFDELLARVSILQNVGDIVEKSILLDTIVIDDNETTDRSFVHHFYILAKVEGKPYLVNLTVDEINPDGKEIIRAYNVDNIKIAPVAASRFSNPAYTTSADGSIASTYTVADLHALVKKYDTDFHPLPSSKKGVGKTFVLPAFIVLSTLLIALYAPLQMKVLVLPFCIALASGLCVSVICQYFMKNISFPMGRIPVWCFLPILLFALGLASFSPLSPFTTDVNFSLEYESGTAYPFIKKSALDIEAALMEWNAFDRLTLHIDQGRAAFTILGGKKRDILAKINELSALYPEIFFYIPEKHTKHAIDVTVYGNDVSEIENNVLQLSKYVNNSANNVNIIYNFKSDVQNIVLEIPVKCASSGFYPYDVYKALYYTASEPVVDKYFADGVETDVKIRGEEGYRKSLAGLLSVPILSPFGIAGEAGDYIMVRREWTQGRIYHKNRMRVLSFSVKGLSRAKLRKLVSDFPFSGSCHGEVH